MPYLTPPPPPPPLKACAAVLSALVLAAALALPASAQQIEQTAIDNSRVLQAAPTHVTRLNQNLVSPAPTVQGRTWTDLVNNREIEVLPGPAGSATTFGAGPGSHCAHSAGVSGGVEFLNPTGTYSHGQPIAIACQTWTTRKCSRSVTFMGRTFTANRGYPRCSEASDDVTPLTGGEYTGNTPNQQDSSFTPTRTPSNGIFRVRVWGKVCTAGGRSCRSLKEGAGQTLLSPNIVNPFGYGATFQHASHCGPERWPSEAWRQRGGPGYAEWCDVTVDVRY